MKKDWLHHLQDVQRAAGKRRRAEAWRQLQMNVRAGRIVFPPLSTKLTGKRAECVIIDDPHNDTRQSWFSAVCDPTTWKICYGDSRTMSESETYNSTTHGSIKLSFTGKRLLANLREAIAAAIKRGEWSDPRMELSHARGELAQYMSELEDRRQPPAAIDPPPPPHLAHVHNILSNIRGMLGMRPFDGDALVGVRKVVDRLASAEATAAQAKECATFHARDAAELRKAQSSTAAQLDEFRRLHAEALDQLAGMERKYARAFHEQAVMREQHEQATHGLRQELDMARKAITDVLSAQPTRILVQTVERTPEVTSEQIRAVHDGLRKAVMSVETHVGFTQSEVGSILRNVFNPKKSG